MNENIDLTKILKDCPKGWKFYSSVYGEVEFMEILTIHSIQRMIQEESCFLSENELRNYPIQFKAQDVIYRVTSEGKHIKGIGECTFFPSSNQRDWSKFTAPWYKKERFDPNTLKPFDKVLVRNFIISKWRCEHFSYFDNGELNPYMTTTSYTFCIPYNDETKHLVGTTKEAPPYYKYWEE